MRDEGSDTGNKITSPEYFRLMLHLRDCYEEINEVV